MGSFDLNQWLAVIRVLQDLGVALPAIIAVIRSALGADDSSTVLVALLKEWQAAKDENDARIKELEKQIAGG